VNTSPIPEVQLAEEALQPGKSRIEERRSPLEALRSSIRHPRSSIWRKLGAFLGWCWRIPVGGLLCFNLFTSIVVIGWLYRWMQGRVLRGWWKQSRFYHEDSFEDWCAALGPAAPVSRPRWFWQERIGARLYEPLANGKQAGSFRMLLRLLRAPWHSLWLNLKIGIQALLSTYLLTGVGCLIMLFSWEFGWLNSFHKGYEQAFIGPLTGLLGIFLFIAAMFYVPMAQVHQAVTEDFRAFFDVRFVWRLIQARLTAYVALAGLILLASLPLEALRTAPLFFDGFIDSWTQASDAEVLRKLQYYFLTCCYFFFLMLLVAHLVAARIYRSAVMKVLERGWVTHEELHSSLGKWLDRLELRPVPTVETAGLTSVVKSGGRLAYRRFLFAVLFLLWLGFIAKVYVGEFLNYHPFTGFLNHPLIQFPSFNYVPSKLSQPGIDGNN
jgi:hypothetical protein